MAEEKITKYDKLNLGLGVFNFVAVVVSIIISFWSINKSEAIAEKSGAFDKGDLRLSFGGYFINSNNNFDVIYGIDFADSTLHFATLPLGIHNIGRKTLENVGVILKYPHTAHIAVDDSLIKFNETFMDPIERKFWTVEPFDQVAFKFNSINPNYSIEAGDLLFLQKETIAKQKFPVTTKDNKIVQVSTVFSYAYSIQIGLTAKDTPGELYKFSLQYRSETDLNKLIRTIVLEKLKTKDEQKTIKDFFVVIPKINKTMGENGYRLLFLNSDATNTFLCQFDETMNFLAVINQDGTLKQQIELSKL